MKVPDTEKKLLTFAKDVIEKCTYSQASRSQEAARNLAYYETGSATETPSLYNRTAVHIDRTASYLYAPGEVRYSIGFDATEGEPWIARAKSASKYLSREYRRADADIVFSQGVKIGLIKDCAILKHNWMERDSLDMHLVHPEFFGVYREDLDRLEDQQAMVHTTYLTKDDFRILIEGRDDESELIKKLDKLGGAQEEGTLKQNWLHQVVISGTNPVALNTPTSGTNQVSISPSSKSNLSPDMIADLLRMDELWVVDEERQDYTTIQLIEGEVLLEGKYRHVNLSGVKGMHPFSKICADPVSGYFWGRSEVSRVALIQDLLSERMEDVRRLLKLQVRPPKALIGFSGMTSKKIRAALAPGGFIQEQSPGAKIDNLIPNMPQELFREINDLVSMFDEMGGFKPIMQGQGESGVRANAHAKTLMRTASPNLRERALKVERDAETSAYIVFRLMQAKEARVFVADQNEKFLLAQLPEDFYVEIDSHSSSPAFIDDSREMAFALKKMGAIDDEDLILLVRPPLEDLLLVNARKRKAAKQKMLEQHPELMTGGKKKSA